MRVYRIKNWAELFETYETRKLKHLTWVPTRNKHDGKGYGKLFAMKNGWQHYLAWTLMVQVASKCSPRGTLQDDEGPLTAEDLFYKTKAPEAVFKNAFKPLCSIGWLELVPYSPAIAADSSGSQQIAGKSPVRIDQTRPEGNRPEGNGKRQPAGATADSFSDRVQVKKADVVYYKCIQHIGWPDKKAAYLSQIVNGDGKYRTVTGKKIILAMILQLPDRRRKLKTAIKSEPRFVGDWFLKWASGEAKGYPPNEKRTEEARKLWKAAGG